MTLRISSSTLLLTSLFIFGCAAPNTQRASVNAVSVKYEERKQLELVAEEMMIEQRRLASVAWALQIKGAPICKDDLRPVSGLNFMNRPKGDIGEVFADKHGIKFGPTVYHVIPDSPADLAGFKAGDVMTHINGEPVKDGPTAQKALKGWAAGEPVQITMVRDGREFSSGLVPEAGCKYTVGLSPDQIINAFADGDNVIITRGMMAFTRTDEELALVISHEIAHNSMKHIDAKRQNMALGMLADLLTVVASKGQVNNPGFAQVGANAYSQDFESEADYVGLYLMANAGLPIDEAPKFWRRMAAAHPQSIKTNHTASHPSTAQRMVALEATVTEIKNKIARGEELIPNMKAGKVFNPNR